MLERLLIELNDQFNFPFTEKDKDGFYCLNVEAFKLKILPLDPGFYVTCFLAPVPNADDLADPDVFYSHITQANYLGQGTGRNTIAVSENGKEFHLCRFHPYETAYQTFEDILERFVNFAEYWQTHLKTQQ
ncbi:MAG: type III secretion system chaperone [Simkaniaceae bacterium]|nr:type III secretion system chaperone [Simkaniaceae bacterium]